ncbi:MAG: globin domain-containing protein [Cyanobacteria bacterium P01_H01_bin.152]
MVSNVNGSPQGIDLQVELLESSFEKMQPCANEFVDSFFANLFTDFPESEPLFAHMNAAHRKNKVLTSLMLVVESAKKDGALDSAMAGISSGTPNSKELTAAYTSIGSTLSKTFAQYLEGDWTPETQQAWGTTYKVITETVLEEEVSEESAEVDEATGLKIALLEQSFEKAKPVANEFVVSFYENLFTDYPAAKPLFAHTDMGDQGRKLLSSLVFVIENLRRPGDLTNALKGLGARHVKYGALPEHYPLVGNTLLKTFEQYLGSEWTPDVKQAWVDAYGLITEVMLDGADYDQAAVQLDETVTVEVPESNIGTGAAAGVIGGGVIALIVLFLLV